MDCLLRPRRGAAAFVALEGPWEMAETAEPSFVPPFSIEIDWEIVISDIRTKGAAIGQKGHLARKHLGPACGYSTDTAKK